MINTLLQTKLYIPQTRTSLVPRPRLVAKLNAGLAGKLTLISAPAGFGKTTLVANWLAHGQRPFCWLSLDEEDNDPQRFFTYMAATLESISDKVKIKQAIANLPVKALTTLLVNNLIQLSEPSVLVLDDYQLIESEDIHAALIFLCEHLPAPLHLVLISRSDPPLPLARMRVRGELNEVRERDLSFTRAETAVFLNQVMGLNLTAQNIDALETRTEGWIASLQLAALSLQNTAATTQFIEAFSGSHHTIMDYLVEEVLAQRPPGTREFLLKTSILNRLSAALCDEILPGSHAQQTLEQLYAANYFLIPLDNERHWYRYHHLFADVLRQRASQVYAQQLPRLYQQAARWFEAHGYLHEAIEMALAGADYDHATTLIFAAAETVIWERGEWFLLDRWVSALPESLVKAQPRLCLYHAWGCFVRGKFATCYARLAEAESSMANMPEVNHQARGELAAIRASIARFQGNQPQVIEQAEIALIALPPANIQWRVMTLLNLGATHFLGDDQDSANAALTEVWQLAKAKNQTMWGVVSASFLAQLQMRNGRYHEAHQLYKQAQKLTQQQESIFNIGMTHIGLGELWLAWNDLDKAQSFLQQGLEIGTLVQNILLISSGSLALARLRQIQGDLDAAKPLLLQAQEIAQNTATTWSWLHVPTAAPLVRAWIKQGDLNAARRVLATAVAAATNQSAFWVESLQIAQAHLLMAEERWQAAEQHLARLWATAVTHKHIQNQIEILILQTSTQQNLQQPIQARAHLTEALILAQPAGNIRLFLDQGQPMQSLISTLHFADVGVQTYAHKISAAFPHQQKNALSTANQLLAEPLTTRELELLTLVATGITNREIAGQLFISYGTVRRHLNNIYGKLGVNGRSQAILKAQELKLV